MLVALCPPFTPPFLVCPMAKLKVSAVCTMIVMACARFLAIQDVPRAVVNFEQSLNFAGIRERKRYCYSPILKR